MIDENEKNSYRRVELTAPNPEWKVLFDKSATEITCSQKFSIECTWILKTNCALIKFNQVINMHKKIAQINNLLHRKAIDYAKSKDVSIIQLTTNIKRPRAKEFYERLGFEVTHVGMKYYLQ